MAFWEIFSYYWKDNFNHFPKWWGVPGATTIRFNFLHWEKKSAGDLRCLQCTYKWQFSSKPSASPQAAPSTSGPRGPESLAIQPFCLWLASQFPDSFLTAASFSLTHTLFPANPFAKEVECHLFPATGTIGLFSFQRYWRSINNHPWAAVS